MNSSVCDRENGFPYPPGQEKSQRSFQRGGVGDGDGLAPAENQSAVLQLLESPIEGGTADPQSAGQVSGGAGEAAVLTIGQKVAGQTALGAGLGQGLEPTGEKTDAAGEVEEIVLADQSLLPAADPPETGPA